MIRAVLWDNDGVLLDSETVFFEITRSAFARLGLDLTKEVWGTQYLGEGRSSREIAMSLGADPVAIGPVLDERNNDHMIALEQPPAIRPHVSETLRALAGRATMGLVTGCHRRQLHLMHRSSGLLGFFDTIVTGDDCTEPKPSPAPYLAAVKALDLDVRDCIAVEDSRRGLLSATAAGIACVVVPTDLTRMQDFSSALAIEPDVSRILKHVRPYQRS
jgi:HAD superfamily hydrolase (TIGR01509 family)